MQIFPPSANVVSRVSLVGAAAVVVGIFALAWVLQRSSYATQRHVAREQPVPFSHAHHVGGLGIDCRYCHVSVETAAFAGIPSVHTCMTCHSQIYADAKILEPLRESWRTGKPLVWTRLNDLPDFVYFNHAIHVHKGVGCAACHGSVDRMPLTWRERPFYMHECLDCHRHPERALGPRLVKQYDVQAMIDCAVCHR